MRDMFQLRRSLESRSFTAIIKRKDAKAAKPQNRKTAKPSSSFFVSLAFFCQSVFRVFWFFRGSARFHLFHLRGFRNRLRASRFHV
jgi:hypothetical protein